MNSNQYEYVGKELEVFSNAINWRAYWQSHIKNHLRGKILEVGAGIGTVSRSLIREGIESWTSMEPDPTLFKQLKSELDYEISKGLAFVICGTLKDLPINNQFDAILYIDVIEHIEDDKGEIINCLKCLKDDGRLIILVPAHQLLYSKFDKAIGHFRRYNKKTLGQLIPEEIEIIESIYLDSVGLIASLANKLIIKTSTPTAGNILFWDKWLVPISKLLDKIIFFWIGKSLLIICQKK